MELAGVAQLLPEQVQVQPPPGPVRGSRARRADALGCTTRLENAHRTVRREVLYRYHPWFGREVSAHAVIDKLDGVVFRCTLEGSEAARWMEIPAWMFDHAACGREPSLLAEPFVSVAALDALSVLLDPALKSSAPSSRRALFASACGTSHDQNRGEAHGAADGGTSEHRSEQPAAWSATDESVQGWLGGRKGRRAGMAGPAQGCAGRAGRPDDAADPGACTDEREVVRDGGDRR